MISISRSLIRQFRAVARRAGLCKRKFHGTPSVRLIASADALQIQTSNGIVAIEHGSSGQFEPADITVPFQLFADCEAKSDGSASIHVDDTGRIVASWNDRSVPQQREYESIAIAPEFPELPREYAANSSSLLKALRDGMATAEEGSTRFALQCLQLRGPTGTIAATDTRQLLVQTGFAFPWQQDLLMQSSDVFNSPELLIPSQVEIGRTEHGITVKAGGWSIYHAIDKKGRFPKLDSTVPSECSIRSRMQLDAIDAEFLTATMDRLPSDDSAEKPVTIELNGAVVVRSRKDAQSPLTELLLSRSKRTGDELRFQTNRGYLARAIRLGFTEIGFVGADRPCVCRDATRTYLWALLEGDGALESDTGATRIDSMSFSAPATRTTRKTGTDAGRKQTVGNEVLTNPVSEPVMIAPAPVNRISKRLRQQKLSHQGESHQSTDISSSASASDMIQQALRLRDQLRAVAQGLTNLMIQIRQQRKQNRLMKSTLQSLKQLQLLDA